MFHRDDHRYHHRIVIAAVVVAVTMRLKRSLLVSAELSVHAEQGNSDVGANPTVAPNVAPFQPESKLEAIRQEEKAINDTQPTNQAPAANRIAADPVHKRHHRPVHHQAAHQARPAHQPHAVRHPVHPAYFRQPSIRRFLIYGRPHNRPDLPLVLIYPRPNTNYSRNTLAMFRAISESPNKPILGLNIIPFLGMNLISEVLGLDLTLIPEHKNDLDQVEDDSIHFPSDMNKDQLLRLMELHGMVPMPKDDDEDSDEVQLTKKDRLPEYHPSSPNSGNRGMLQLMSNYNRPREVDDESVPRIQPRSLGILAKFHPRFNIKNEGDLEISEVNRKRRSADEEKQEDKSSTTTSTTESSSSTTESDSKHSNSSSESSDSKHSESSNKETESSEESSESKESSENNNSTTESSNSNSTTTADETHKTVSQILEQLLVEVIEFLFH